MFNADDSAADPTELRVAATETLGLLRRTDTADALRRAKSHARFVTGRDGQRERIAAQNTVILTTSGMLSGGPAMTYIPEIRGRPVNKIAMTGYQVEGTPGRDLLETGSAEIDGRRMPVAAQVEQYDFSAHADRAGLALRSPRADEQRGAMVILEADRADLLCAWLKERGIYTDSRQRRYLRLAPWVWNTLSEVDRAFDVIAEG